MRVEWTSLRDEIRDSFLRATRWIIGGASGGLVATWILADVGDLAVVFGTVLLLLLSIFVDMFTKLAVTDHFHEKK